MSHIKNLFKSTEKTSEVTSAFPWIPLTNLNQIESIKSQSETDKVLVFKHSTRCGISRSVLKQFEKSQLGSFNDCVFYYLDLLKHRDISNALALEFTIEHQSPQVLLIKNRGCVATASHYDILELDF